MKPLRSFTVLAMALMVLAPASLLHLAIAKHRFPH
jgi:hypothetical protein